VEAPEPLRLLLDADLSSHNLTRILREHGHDVLPAGLSDGLSGSTIRFSSPAAQAERRVTITHNFHDFPDILRDWAEAGRTHHGCIIFRLPTNAYGENRL
jgi:hypothetical protein